MFFANLQVLNKQNYFYHSYILILLSKKNIKKLLLFFGTIYKWEHDKTIYYLDITL